MPRPTWRRRCPVVIWPRTPSNVYRTTAWLGRAGTRERLLRMDCLGCRERLSWNWRSSSMGKAAKTSGFSFCSFGQGQVWLSGKLRLARGQNWLCDLLNIAACRQWFASQKPTPGIKTPAVWERQHVTTARRKSQGQRKIMVRHRHIFGLRPRWVKRPPSPEAYCMRLRITGWGDRQKLVS